MNKLELIGKLQMVYVGDRNALNELVGYYDGLKKGIEEMQQELNQKNKIIEEIKEWLKEEKERYYGELGIHQKLLIEKVLDKIEELEKGSEE